MEDKYSCSEVAMNPPRMTTTRFSGISYQIRSNSNNNNIIVIDFGNADYMNYIIIIIYSLVVFTHNLPDRTFRRYL